MGGMKALHYASNISSSKSVVIHSVCICGAAAADRKSARNCSRQRIENVSKLQDVVHLIIIYMPARPDRSFLADSRSSSADLHLLPIQDKQAPAYHGSEGNETVATVRHRSILSCQCFTARNAFQQGYQGSSIFDTLALELFRMSVSYICPDCQTGSQYWHVEI